MIESEIFGYPIVTYLWVIGLSSVAGAVKFLNEFAHAKQFEAILLIRDMLTGALSGLMAFWLCDSFKISIPLNLVIVTLSGIMGNRAWAEFEYILKALLLRQVDGQSKDKGTKL